MELKKKENLNLLKLPEVPDRKKRDDACVKEKDHPLDKGKQALFLFQTVSSVLTTPLLTCLGTTHTSLNLALVSPFHPVVILSRSALC